MTTIAPAPVGRATRPDSPVRLRAELDPSLSRIRWLLKWFLSVPHYLVLALLWAGFAACTVLALFAVLFTGRYPEPLFRYAEGVLRWNWRVSYYSFSALATDRYPPFTLAEVSDYPAGLVVRRPERLSHGLPLVKWLLAVPHYVVLAVCFGGGGWALAPGVDTDALRRGDVGDFLVAAVDNWTWGALGLVGLLLVGAMICLVLTGTYPRPVFDLVVAMHSWAIRVVAYVALMTDAYPPFRLDTEPPDAGGSAAAVSAPPADGRA